MPRTLMAYAKDDAPSQCTICLPNSSCCLPLGCISTRAYFRGGSAFSLLHQLAAVAFSSVASGQAFASKMPWPSALPHQHGCLPAHEEVRTRRNPQCRNPLPHHRLTVAEDPPPPLGVLQPQPSPRTHRLPLDGACPKGYVVAQGGRRACFVSFA